MENTSVKAGFRKKFLGDKAFYKMVLAIAIPIMIQNGITNFVSLLDNIMIGRIGTGQMSGAAISCCLSITSACSAGYPELVFSLLSMQDRRITRVCVRLFDISCGW